MHIRQGFSAACNGFKLFVESGAEQWTALVRDPDSNRTLYTAQRFNAAAAKDAAIEFATLCAPCRVNWQPYW